MPNTPIPFSLRQILLADAATCTVMGALLAIASRPVAGLTQIPGTLLFYAGLSLFPIAVLMAIIGLRFTANAAGVRLVIVGNILWVVASVTLLFGPISPNAFGVVFILAQATAVAVFAWLEHSALRANGGQTEQAA